MKILIVGAAKSGTTGLYFNLKNSLPKNTYCLFEPAKFNDKLLESQSTLVKILISNKLDYDKFMTFDKVIFISRDPRDRIISELLYVIGFHFYEMKIDDEILLQFYKLLQQKEHNPDSISFKELFSHIEKIQPFLLRGYKDSIDFINKYNNIFLYKYEDFCSNNNQELKEFLQIEISSDKSIDKDYNRVIRTKSFENWKNWFTGSDKDYFLPLFKDYMVEFNYDWQNWDLNKNQTVLKEHASEYLLNLINQRKKMLGLTPLATP